MNELQSGKEYVSEVKAQVLEGVDVGVAGGGMVGVTAVLAAARAGAKTMLVEASGSLGGMMTRGNAGLTMYMKFSGRPASSSTPPATATWRCAPEHPIPWGSRRTTSVPPSRKSAR